MLFIPYGFYEEVTDYSSATTMRICIAIISLFIFFDSMGQPSKEEYFEKANFIWRNYVPKNGQSEYVRGELLRAVEKLRDEVHRNGNINFHPNCHGILVEYLRKFLIHSEVFSNEHVTTTSTYLDRLLQGDYPYTDDDIFDYLNDRVVDWANKQSKLIPHEKNSKLYC